MTRRMPSPCVPVFFGLLLLCGAIALPGSRAIAQEMGEPGLDIQINRMQVDDPGTKEPGDDDQPTIVRRRPRPQTGAQPPTGPAGLPPDAPAPAPSEPFWFRWLHVLFGRFGQILR